MNWDDLRIFLAVSRHGLIARAAAELRTDPTTVSRRVQRLEQAIGQTLLERHRDGSRLTAAGRRIAERAEAMEAASAPLVEGDREGGLLRVSATEGFGTWFVAHHLPAFAEHHPGVEVELVASSGFLSPSRRETDMAILLAKPRRGPLVTRKLTAYTLGFYGNRQKVAQGDPIVEVADLRRHVLVGYIPDLIYAPELDYLREVAPGLQAQLRSSSINAQYRLIAAGAGIGVLPRFIGAADPALVSVLPAIRIERSFWVSIHREALQRPPVRAFVDWLVDTTRSHRSVLVQDHQ